MEKQGERIGKHAHIIQKYEVKIYSVFWLLQGSVATKHGEFIEDGQNFESEMSMSSILLLQSEQHINALYINESKFRTRTPSQCLH